MYLRILKNLNFYLKKESRKLRALIFQPNYSGVETFPKFSAYLSIYNDADILDKTLESIKEYVDDLVVVDGAYEWNSTYLEAIGLKPERSEDSVYAKLDRSGIPYRSINKIWKNEVEKRIAGYNACTSRYVMRVDADEVIYFNRENLGYFFASGCAIAEMFMPNYAAPGYVIRGNSLLDKYRTFPRQTCLFDSSKITADDHLKYLWLVLTADELPDNEVNQKVYPLFERPIAFCAHLTNWRSVASSMLRSSFYNMNWMRKHGAPWVKSINSSAIVDFDEFFSKISPKRFLEVMRNSLIAQGDIKLRANEVLEKSPLSMQDEAQIFDVYRDFMSSLEAQTLSLSTEGSVCLQNYPLYIDISNSSLCEKIVVDGKITIQFDEGINEVEVRFHTFKTNAPYAKSCSPAYHFDGNNLEIELQELVNDVNALRRVLMVVPKSDNYDKAWVDFRISTE